MNESFRKTVEDRIQTIPFKRREAVDYAANLETIRINRWEMHDEHEQKVAGLDTTTQNLDTKKLRGSYIYIINNITGVEEGTKPTTIRLGFVRGSHFNRLTIQTPANNNDSVEYVGQVILREGDRVRAQFKGATAADTIHLYANGYKIRK